MSALLVSFAALALVLGSLIVFGLYRLSHELGLIELHLGAIRRALSDLNCGASTQQDGSRS